MGGLPILRANYCQMTYLSSSPIIEDKIFIISFAAITCVF